MNNDAREAAERRERLRGLFGRKNKFGNMSTADYLAGQTWSDLWNECRASVAEHLADDHEPLTEEWLIETGFTDSEGYGLEVSIRNKETGADVAYRANDRSLWFYMDRPIATPTTRGDVRRLCSVLGVKLETTK